MNRETLKTLVLCTLAITCMEASDWSLNVDFIAPLTRLDPALRDLIFIGASASSWIAFAAVFSRRVIAKHTRILAIASIVIVGASALAAALASSPSSTSLYACALAFSIIGSAWIAAATILALCQLKSPTLIAFCFCTSLGLGTLLQNAFGNIDPNVRLIAYFALKCAALALSHTLACAFLSHTAAEPPRDLTIRQPKSFIGASNPAFLCFFIFAFLSGFTLALGAVEGVPLNPSSLTPLGFLAAAALLLAVKKQTFVDFVSKTAALTTVAGLLLAISIGSTKIAFLANVVMNISNACFSMLFMLCVTAMCERNPSGSPTVIAFSELPQAIGICLGALSGHAANALSAQHPEITALFLSGMLVAFVALCFAWISRYKFTDIIFDIQPLQKSEGNLAAHTAEEPFIEQRCAKVAAERGLTNRESEILVMLAKGRNGKFIEDFYTVSYNTVKTHVKHIYTKLDVHSQQELIDLVERTLS